MLVAVKTPHTKFTIEGNSIPKALLDFIQKTYGAKGGVIEQIDDSYEDVFESDWYQNIRQEHHPGMSVKTYRDNLGITQKELGSILGGFSAQYVSDLENGRRPISKKIAVQLSQIFKIPVDRFLTSS